MMGVGMNEPPKTDINAASPQPVSSAQKERLGVGELPVPSDSAPDVPPEIQELGVESRHETQGPVLIDAKAARAGIELAKESIPHPITPSGIVKIPGDPSSASRLRKAYQNTANSITWLIRIAVKQFKRNV